MAKEPDLNVKFFIVPQTWYGRLFAAVAGALLFLLLIFFFTLFLIVFVLLAIVVTIYIFLFGRKFEKTTSPNIIQVEYFLASPEEEPKNPDEQ
jgi:predicted membrane protein